MSRFTSGSAVAAAVLVLAVAGCGGSSKKSSTHKSSTSAATSTTPTGATTAIGGQPLSKAAYEARLGPLLNDRVGPALRSALSNGGAKDPDKLKIAAGLLNEARNAMASITPPAKIADLNREAVTLLGSLANDLSRMSNALTAHEKGAYADAGKAAVRDALKVQELGNQLTARGY